MNFVPGEMQEERDGILGETKETTFLMVCRQVTEITNAVF
jgi:hypothetical protein